MSTPNLLWVQWLAVLAVEAGLLGCLLALLLRHRAAVWRRTFCQAATVALLLLVASELSGEARHWAAWVLARVSPLPARTALAPVSTPPSPTALRVAANLRLAAAPSDAHREQFSSASSHVAQPTGPVAASMAPSASAGGLQPPESQFPEKAQITGSRGPNSPVPAQASKPAGSTSLVPGFALLWGLGILAVLARAAFARSLCLVFRCRRKQVQDASVRERAQVLSRQLGAPRGVRLLESPRLSTPIAFGWLQPTIGLPTGFCARFDAPKREAMLAHELAHLAARDPFWCLLADVATAVLWWHPVSWWMRRQLLFASEFAADEACLVLSDGPRALAECLVQLGSELVAPAPAGPLQMTGFRSQLGRRVHRLLHLEPGNARAVRRRDAALVKVTVPLILSGLVILCSAWFTPETLMKGDAMKSMQQNLKRSFATVGLLAAFNAAQPITPAAEPAPPAPVPPAAAPNSAAPAPPAVAPAAGQDSLNDAFRRRYGLAPAAAPDRTSAEERLRQRYGLPPGSVHVLGQETGKAGGKVEAKLNTIVLSEVMFDGLPLSEVVRSLSDTARKLDPGHQGVNFLIDPNATAPAAFPGAVDPTTGLPVAAPAEALDVNSITIKFSLPLRNVTLKQALDAIVKVADHPLTYSVEDYAVVFSAKPEAVPTAVFPSEPLGLLQVRAFRLDTNTIAAGIESAFGITVKTSAHESSAARSRDLEAAMRNVMDRLGVSMTNKKAVFYNDLTGILMVRVAPEDVETVSAAMELLGGKPILTRLALGQGGMAEAGPAPEPAAGLTSGPGNQQLSKVSFILGPAHFAKGDRIIIDEVLATSTNLAAGDKVVVRGRYDLDSGPAATLALYLTSDRGAGEPDVPTQSTEIRRGSGQFELSEVIRHPGYLHLSFYHPSGGADFGCVYFGTERQMSRIKNWNLAGE